MPQAHVHLFCISEQSVPPGAHCEKPAKLVLEYAARARLGWPDLLEGSPAVRVAESRARITAPPRDAVSARLVQLRVDSAKGAGVELEPDAHGDVCDFLGQPKSAQSRRPGFGPPHCLRKDSFDARDVGQALHVKLPVSP